MTSSTAKPLAGIGLAALLALTACGDSSDAESSDADLPDTDGDAHSMPESDGTYDFTPDTAAASGEELRIEVPQDLAEASEDYSENRVLDAVTLRATDETESQCAIEVEYEYRDGVQDEIENNKWVRTFGPDTHGEDLPAEERYRNALLEGDDRHFLDTLTVAEDHQSFTVEMDCAASPNDTENAFAIPFKSLSWQEGEYELREEAGGPLIEHPLDEDTTCQEIQEEYPGASCQQHKAQFHTLATAEITAMASGKLHVVNSEVEGFNYEPDHGWIGEDQQVDSDGNVIDG